MTSGYTPASPRMAFQMRYFTLAPKTDPPSVLNVGCSTDPLGFGEGAMHFDIDDWSKHHKYFTQGDVHQLPFPDQAYHTVLLGDVLEHVTDPQKAVVECARVAQVRFIMTVFEEWRLPGLGQHIEAGQELARKTVAAEGFESNMKKHESQFPTVVLANDDETPLLCHINQFSDADIDACVARVQAVGFKIVEYRKAYEARHEGHPWYNWLVCMERTS